MTAALRMHVAAGVLLDSAGRVLVTERLGDSPFAGLWEFPGGKIQDGETPAAALVRELQEELGIVASGFEHFMQLMHEYADRSVALEFFLVHDWRGEPRSCDGQAMQWRLPGEIKTGELLPADAPVLRALRARQERCRKPG